MTKLYKQIFSIFAVGALMLSAVAPAMASTTIEISGNGSGSNNWTTVEQDNTTTVNQNNRANVTNEVDADADTGNNDANHNTGGDVQIGTGNAKSNVNVQNELNSNSADVDCCETNGTDVEISGNGADSVNTVRLNKDTETTVNQINRADVTNEVDAEADTGDNDANANNGGDVQIGTGNAVTEVNVSTNANANVANVGSDNGASNPSASFVISGNGSGSSNHITGLNQNNPAQLSKTTTVNQNNRADVTNEVDADADTGDNDADHNTGGDVLIGTGHAVVLAGVDNAVNFNHADVDCGCTWDVLAKISGNGAGDNESGSTNQIGLNLASVQEVGQGNYANLDNNLEYLNADTGENDAIDNTGEVDSDPAIGTGDAVVESGVSNSGNVNTVGTMPNFSNLQVPNVDFSFNMAALWAMISGSMSS